MIKILLKLFKNIGLLSNFIFLLTLSVQEFCFASNSNKTINDFEIIHLQHNKKTASFYKDAKKELAEMEACVQYEVAQYILKHPGIPVVSGYLGYNVDCINTSEACKIVQNIFPFGLPSDFSQLSNAQKKVLYEHGGALVLVYLGLLPKVYKSTDKETDDKFTNQVIDEMSFKNASEAYEDFLELKIKSVLEQIEISAKENPQDFSSRKVFLIFEINYDFKKESRKRGYKLSEVNLLRSPPLYSLAKKIVAEDHTAITIDDSLFSSIEEIDKYRTIHGIKLTDAEYDSIKDNIGQYKNSFANLINAIDEYNNKNLTRRTMKI